MISSALADVSAVAWVSTCTCGFTSPMRSRAESSLGRPMSFVPCITCRCRLVTSTLSKSTMPRCPTPAAARYNASGDPNPPAPTISTRPFFSFCCPASPTSGSSRCRLYRSSSSRERLALSPAACPAGRGGCVAVTVMESSSRYGGHDDDFVAVTQRRLKAAVKADVLIIQIEGHEWIGLAGIVAQAWPKRGKPRNEIGHGIPDSRAACLELSLVRREPGQHGGQHDGYAHEYLSSGEDCMVCSSSMANGSPPGSVVTSQRYPLRLGMQVNVVACTPSACQLCAMPSATARVN